MQKERFIERGFHKDKRIGVLTSGSDSQGMNAAIRAVVRMSLYLGCKVYFIREGFQGLVDGGKNIYEADWYSVSSIIHLGGSILSSQNCLTFRTREGRLKAAYNLILNDISYLIVIGGGGSLTAANILRTEWIELLNELAQKGDISEQDKLKHNILHIVGIVASVLHDFFGTDISVGTDSALHRIIECVDAICDTAFSHKRIFVIEVMGESCGYLSLCAGIASEADYIFVPEDPVIENWQDDLCNKLIQEREAGQRLNIIIVAEGARDCNNNQITVTDVRNVLVDRLQMDARESVLGHYQQGGSPSAFDRILGCRMGAEAVMTLVEAKEDSPPFIIALEGNQITRVPLLKCIQRDEEIVQAIKDKNWQQAMKLRGPIYGEILKLYKVLSNLKPPKLNIEAENKKENYRLAIMHIGAPACGMNASVRSFVRSCINQEITPLGIQDGVEGLISGKIKEMKWSDVSGWTRQGGCNLGTKRTLPEGKFKKIAGRFKENKIQGLCLVGGFAAFESCIQLVDQRCNFQEFCIPIIIVPATISNNVPGTDCAIGCDTGLNEITEICDRILESAKGIKRRVFVVETKGEYCGYLAVLSALTSGADAVYINEEKFSIKNFSKDIEHVVTKMDNGVPHGLVIVNEKASVNYTTDIIHRFYAEEGKGKFSCRKNILGHMQEGRACSPFDRLCGVNAGSMCSKWLINQIKKNQKGEKIISHCNQESACLLGLVCHRYQFTPINQIIGVTNFEKQIPKKQWWLKLRPLLKILSKHSSVFEEEGIYVAIDHDCNPYKMKLL